MDNLDSYQNGGISNIMSYYNNYNPMQQQMPQNYPPMDQSPNTNCNFIYVNGFSQVQEYIVRPNQKLYFLDNNNNLMYTKEANSFGIATTETFEVNKIDNVPVATPPTTNQNDTITREEFDSLKSQLNELQNRLNKQHNKGENKYESTKNNSKRSNGRANENT